MRDPRATESRAPSAIADRAIGERLLGVPVPALTLASTAGRVVLAELASDLLVLFVYPHATGLPRAPVPGWDLIPGARGCTAEACGFRDDHDRLKAFGATVAGLSTQSSEEQRAFAGRMGLPYSLVSDPERGLATALGLPMFAAGGMTFYRRLTLVARAGHIAKVFSPIVEPERQASEVIAWLEASEGATPPR
jgi:peroxiredoxin